jgi:translation initiation factor 2 beta subunit (eIF-2beta)/eIF-5
MNTRPPKWVHTELQRALTRFYMFQAATLDEAFGIEKRAKDARGIARLKRRSEKTSKVMDLVLKAKRDNKALDRDLFETIAGELGINKNEAAALWKESQRIFPIPLKRKPPKHKR